jgi:multidrug resistance efflux pump
MSITQSENETQREAAPAATTALANPFQGWLETQTSLVHAARAGLVVVHNEGAYHPVALWPSVDAAGPLIELTERVIAEKSGQIVELPATTASVRTYGIAYPLQPENEIVAVIALAVAAADTRSLQQAMRQVQWGSAGLQLLLENQSRKRDHARRAALEASVDLLSSVLAESRFDGAAIAFATGLAGLIEADRVSLGFIKKDAVKVDHISHTSQIGERMNLVRLIEAAMDEAIDQRTMLRLPAPEGHGRILLAHERFTAGEPQAVLTLPLYVDGEPVGALMAERPLERPFTDDEAEKVESLSALVVAALEEKRQNDRPLYKKAVEEGRDLLQRYRKPGNLQLKAATGAAAVLLLFLCLGRGTYWLSADAVLEAREQRVLSAPFDGYVRTAPLRAGDHVRRGEMIAALDDSDLALERAKWMSQYSRAEGLYQDAAAQDDRVQTNVAAAQREEARAQLDLADALIARARIAAPFDGVVVSGDLSQRIGGSVTKGEQLFAVAPNAGYRADLLIKESRIATVKVGQRGVLHLSALPSRSFDFTVQKITPKTVAENGTTYFVVEGVLDNADMGSVQPGMQGVGKVEIGGDWLIAIWSRDIREWLRLHLWKLAG